MRYLVDTNVIVRWAHADSVDHGLLADIREIFTCLPEPPDMADRWQAVAERYSVQGKQAHDARIAALMLAHGVPHLLTFNSSDFTRYEGLTPVTPNEIAAG